tara:strand:- start:125 stop:361 length:237 start_codon:yes stop_codon:yes gene_type:complete
VNKSICFIYFIQFRFVNFIRFIHFILLTISSVFIRMKFYPPDEILSNPDETAWNFIRMKLIRMKFYPTRMKLYEILSG